MTLSIEMLATVLWPGEEIGGKEVNEGRDETAKAGVPNGYKLRDLWQHKYLEKVLSGGEDGAVQLIVPAHGVRMLKLTLLRDEMR